MFKIGHVFKRADHTDKEFKDLPEYIEIDVCYLNEDLYNCLPLDIKGDRLGGSTIFSAEQISRNYVHVGPTRKDTFGSSRVSLGAFEIGKEPVCLGESSGADTFSNCTTYTDKDEEPVLSEESLEEGIEALKSQYPNRSSLIFKKVPKDPWISVDWGYNGHYADALRYAMMGAPSSFYSGNFRERIYGEFPALRLDDGLFNFKDIKVRSRFKNFYLSIYMTMHYIANKILDTKTNRLVKAGLLDKELELTDEGRRAIASIIFDKFKPDLVKLAEEKLAHEKENKE